MTYNETNYNITYNNTKERRRTEMKFYTLTQIAELLQMNEQTIRRYAREGKLKAALFGREYRVREDDLNHFYESKRPAS